MVVAASCFGDVIQRQELRDLSGSIGKMKGAKYREIFDQNLLQSAQDLRMV